jgi:hypothetical protein
VEAGRGVLGRSRARMGRCGAGSVRCSQSGVRARGARELGIRTGLAVRDVLGNEPGGREDPGP